MRPRPRPVLVLFFVLLMATLWYAHAPPDARTSRALLDGAESLRAHYRKTPPAGGWTLAGVAVREGAVWVDLTPPAAEAARLAVQDHGARAAALAPHCPGAADIVWRLLAPGQTVEVRALAPAGGAPTAVDCRSLRR